MGQSRPNSPVHSPGATGAHPKKLKKAPAHPKLSRLARLAGALCEAMNTVPGRPALFLLFLLAANFQGHYLPLLWSYSPRPALFPALLLRRSLTAAPALPRSLLPLPAVAGDPAHAAAAAAAAQDSDAQPAPLGSRVPAASSAQEGLSGGEEHAGAGAQALAHSTQTGAGAGAGAGAGGEDETASSAAAQQQVQASRDSLRKEDGNDVPEDEGDRFTPYLNYHRIDVTASPVCHGILRRQLLQNVNRKPITDLRTLDEMNRRALVFMARYGLGNSLRGFTSAYVYARLSGRTLVRFHGAEHTKVYDSLCMAFKCGFDSIHWDNSTTPMALYRALDQLNPFPMHKTSVGVRDSLTEDVPVMVSRSPSHFDGFWRNSPRIQACVFSAFACSSVWCVHSRAIHGLLKGPTPILKDVVKQILRRHIPGTGDKPEDAAGKDIMAVDETDASSGKRKPVKGLVGMFDVALHMRTRTAAIESLDGRDAELSKVGCYEKPSKKPGHEFLKPCLWNCISSIILALEKSRLAFWEAQRKAGSSVPRPARLSILLTTDNEQLRPTFVRRLSALGDVYFSQGGIVHLSKSSGSDMERLPTMAEFFLMAKSHTIIEAGSYVSTFAYFAALFGNGTLASIEWYPGGGCGLKLTHQGEIARYFPKDKA